MVALGVVGGFLAFAAGRLDVWVFVLAAVALLFYLSYAGQLGAFGAFLAFMLEGVRRTIAALVSFPLVVPFVFVYILASLFLVTNAALFWPDATTQWQILVLIYLVASLFALVNTTLPNPFFVVSTMRFLVIFAIGIVLGAMLLKLFGVQTAPPPEVTRENLGTLYFHLVHVAIGEEMLFRYTLPAILAMALHPMAAQGISALAFGFFHYSVYQGSFASMWWAALLGFVFGMLTIYWPRGGLILAMGSHAGYNITVQGFI